MTEQQETKTTQEVTLVNSNETSIETLNKQKGAVHFVKNYDVLSLEQKLEYCQVLVDSNLLPVRKSRGAIIPWTKEEVLLIVSKGIELGIPPIASLSNIHVINGNTTLSYAAMGNLLLRNGIIYRLKDDMVKFHNDMINKEDYKTTFEFIRVYNGEKYTYDYTFTWSDAVKMELVKPDSSWNKQPKVMMRARALSGGARLYFPDVLLGTLYLADELNANVSYDEDGNVVVKDI